MLTWTKTDYECDFFGPTRLIKRFTGTANGVEAYHIELDPHGYWGLYRLWTRNLVSDDRASSACPRDAEEIKAKAEEDLLRWRKVLDELTKGN
jgi:hypothetical protein